MSFVMEITSTLFIKIKMGNQQLVLNTTITKATTMSMRENTTTKKVTNMNTKANITIMKEINMKVNTTIMTMMDTSLIRKM